MVLGRMMLLNRHSQNLIMSWELHSRNCLKDIPLLRLPRRSGSPKKNQPLQLLTLQMPLQEVVAVEEAWVEEDELQHVEWDLGEKVVVEEALFVFPQL